MRRDGITIRLGPLLVAVRMKRFLRLATIATGVVGLLVPASAAYAHDNACVSITPTMQNCDIHWHYTSPAWPKWQYYRRGNVDLVPLSGADLEWTGETVFDPLYLGVDNDTRLDEDRNIVAHNQIPSTWTTACPRSTSLACTLYVFAGNQGTSSSHCVAGTCPQYGHMVRADMMLNSAFSFTNDCLPTAPLFFDAQTIFLHEMGHTALNGHSTSAGSSMATNYTICDRTLSSHDKTSANLLYTHAGH